MAAVPPGDQPVLPRSREGLQAQPPGPRLQDTIEKLEVHIDAIKPVWRTDVAEWFNGLEPDFKMLMHPIDAANAAHGRGLDHPDRLPPLQPVSHSRASRSLHAATDPRRTDFGPIQFLTDKVLPKMNDPRLRLYGVTHVAVGLDDDREGMDDREGQGQQQPRQPHGPPARPGLSPAPPRAAAAERRLGPRRYGSPP